MNREIKINYKEYPEYMFAIIAAYLNPKEGHVLRQVSHLLLVEINKNGIEMESFIYKNKTRI